MEYRSERNAMLEMRKHMAWYLKRERNAKVYRQEINSISRFTDLERLVQKILDEANS
jgi:tRNA-dihydrouridine synthase